MRTLCRALHICLAALLLVALAAPCYAATAPSFKTVASWEEFLARYHSGDGPSASGIYVSYQPLTCTVSAVLGGTQGHMELTAVKGLRVAPGAVLTVDNPKLLLMGPPPFITVEQGGTLRILRWNKMMADGTMPTPGMIQVEAGGTLQVAEGLTLPDGMVSLNADGIFQKVDMPPPGTTPTPTPTPDPNPVPEPTPKPLPLTITQWQRRSDRLALWFETTPCGLIEEDIKSIEIYRSRDGSAWQLRQTLKWDEKYDGLVPEAENAHSSCWVLNGTLKLQYAQSSYDGPFYLRVSIAMDTGTLESQALLVRLPDELITPPNPGNSVGSAEKDEDGSTGNRGGGQGEFDREGQIDAVETPAPPEVAAETAPPAVIAETAPPEVVSDGIPPQGAKPQQTLDQQSEAAPAEEESSLSGSTYTGGGAANDHLGQSAGRVVFSENLAAKEDGAEVQQPVDEAVHLDEVVEEAEPTASSEVSEAQVQTLAVEQEEIAPPDDGDTSGLVAVATLSVCLSSAAGIYFIHKHSLKRKS